MTAGPYLSDVSTELAGLKAPKIAIADVTSRTSWSLLGAGEKGVMTLWLARSGKYGERETMALDNGCRDRMG